MAWQIVSDNTLGDFTPTTRWQEISSVSVGDFSPPPSWQIITDVVLGDFTPPPSWQIITDTVLGDFVVFRDVYSSTVYIAVWRDVYSSSVDLTIWQDVYSTPVDIAVWQDVYSSLVHVPAWLDVYSSSVDLAGWQDVYSTPVIVPGWNDIYSSPVILGGWVDVYSSAVILTAWKDIYSTEVAIEGWNDIYSTPVSIGAPIPEGILYLTGRVGGASGALYTASRVDGLAKRVSNNTLFRVSQPNGIAWDGETLFMADSAENALMTVNRITGISSRVDEELVNFGAGIFSPSGLTWDGMRLWMLSERGIATVDRKTGVATIFDSNVRGQGLTWDGSRVLVLSEVSGTSRDGLFSYNPDTMELTLVDNLPLEHGLGSLLQPEGNGVTWDGQNVFIVVDFEVTRRNFETRLYKLSKDGSNLERVGDTADLGIPGLNANGLAFVPGSEAWVDVYSSPVNLVGWTDVYSSRVEIGDSFDIEGAEVAGDILSVSVRIGRIESSHLARVLPMQMQMVLDNSQGNNGPGVYTPQTKFRFVWKGIHIASGWITDVQSSRDHVKGLDTVIVRAEGSLARLARSLYELSLFRAETSKTGDIITDALDQANWPLEDRHIDKGMVRIHAAHYTNILAGRRIQRAGPVIRAVEQAEIGLVHEGRGDQVVFQNRIHRELQVGPSPWRITHSAGDVIPEKIVTQTENWDNIYTNIQVGAERAIVQAERVVWELQNDLELNAGDSFVVDLLRENDPGVQNDAVRSVIEWSPLRPDDAEGIEVRLDQRTRTRTRVTAVTSGTLKKLELRGRGIGLYGDLTIPELANETAVDLYGRRTLVLPVSFIGDGINTGGNAVEEGRAYAEFFLWRYSRPPALGRIPINPNHFPEIVRDVQISDDVAIGPETGMEAGTYNVEGWEFQYDGSGRAEFYLNVSRRGGRVLVRNQSVVSVTVSDWRDIASQNIVGSDDDLHIVCLYARMTADDESVDEEEHIVRLLKDGELFREWTRLDLAVGEDVPIAAVVSSSGTYTFQARGLGQIGIATSRFQVVRMIQ